MGDGAGQSISGIGLQPAFGAVAGGQKPLDHEHDLFLVGTPGTDHRLLDIERGIFRNAKAGASGAKILATYIVEKGKPLASPVK